jgi:hypothetical protein
MVAVVFLLTASVLTLIQARMRIHVREDLVSTLRAESALYTQIEEARSDQARQSATLIADQPILKALMSTNDRLTVEDGSESLLQTSHADILVLQNPAVRSLPFTRGPTTSLSRVSSDCYKTQLENRIGGLSAVISIT